MLQNEAILYQIETAKSDGGQCAFRCCLIPLDGRPLQGVWIMVVVAVSKHYTLHMPRPVAGGRPLAYLPPAGLALAGSLAVHGKA